MINDTSEFVRQLQGKLIWDEEGHFHWMGKKDNKKQVMTNLGMRTMCSHYYGTKYDDLLSGEQRRVRESIFDAIRYGDEL